MDTLKIATLLLIILQVTMLSGCCSLTYYKPESNMTTCFNDCVDAQSRLDVKMDDAVSSLNSHIDTYNLEMSKSSPDYDLVIRNFNADEARFESISKELGTLDKCITLYSAQCSAESASLAEDKQFYASGICKNFRQYQADLSSARLGYISYCSDVVSYAEGAKSGEPHEALKSEAGAAKEKADGALSDASACLDTIDEYYGRLATT